MRWVLRISERTDWPGVGLVAASVTVQKPSPLIPCSGGLFPLLAGRFEASPPQYARSPDLGLQGSDGLDHSRSVSLCAPVRL